MEIIYAKPDMHNLNMQSNDYTICWGSTPTLWGHKVKFVSYA